MSYGFLIAAFAYVAFVLAVYGFEARRTRNNGIDPISLFVTLLLLQCCFPVVVIYSLLPFLGRDDLTGVYAFDRVLRHTDLSSALLILVLTVLFLISFYLSCGLGRKVLDRLFPTSNYVIDVRLRGVNLGVLLLVGIAFTLYSFVQLGDSWVGRYANLVLLRADDPQVERTALNATAFSLTETWSWLSIVAIFSVWESRCRRLVLPVLISAAVVFAVLGASRRAIFIPLVMTYLVIALYSNRWKIRWVVVAALPLIAWVAFGKNLLAALAYDGTLEAVASTYGSWKNAAVRAASDIGITVVESLGTLQFIDLPPRLGLDHVLSMIKIFPERMLGFDVEYPERIVRISTEALDGPNELDLPPGLLGQMWLDFRLAGPLIWGLVFGLQISVLQWAFRNIRCTRQSSAVFVLLVFMVALPLNTGSFDFTFSIDIVAIIAALCMCLRLGRSRLVVAQEFEAGHR